MREEEQRRKREQCRLKIEELLGSSGIKARFATRTFESYEETPENKLALALAKKYTRKFAEYFRRGYGIYFEGTKGTGKTHLAVAIALQLIREGVPVVFRTSIDLLAELRETYDRRSGHDEKKIIQAYATVDLLIIDDLGKERPSEWTVDRLFAIINERYENMKPIIITTNYNQSELIKRLTPPGGDSKTAEAIISRLKECTGAVTMMGQDWRLK